MPSSATTSPFCRAIHSSVRVLVDPTATTRWPAAFVALIFSALAALRRVAFAFHAMIFNFRRAHRLKSTRPDMQRQQCAIDSLGGIVLRTTPG